MTFLFQFLFFLIVLSLGQGLDLAGLTQFREAGQNALHALWGMLATLAYLTFWVVCGLVAGVITRRKRHGFALGCIGGILLGPLALLIALLVPRR
jgi:uncharacterized membrane protein YhdT